MTAATTPKGERRRAALVAAAGELLVENGVDSVRHRSVAHRAHIPLAATTYYFESLDDLLSNAVAYAGEQHLAAVSARVEQVSRRRRGDSALARLLASTFFACETEAERSELVSRYERLVRCTRDPAMMRLQAKSRETLVGLHAEVLERSGRRALVPDVEQLMAIEDGAVLAAFVDPAVDVERAIRDAVTPAIDRLAPTLG